LDNRTSTFLDQTCSLHISAVAEWLAVKAEGRQGPQHGDTKGQTSGGGTRIWSRWGCLNRANPVLNPKLAVGGIFIYLFLLLSAGEENQINILPWVPICLRMALSTPHWVFLKWNTVIGEDA